MKSYRQSRGSHEGHLELNSKGSQTKKLEPANAREVLRKVQFDLPPPTVQAEDLIGRN